MKTTHHLASIVAATAIGLPRLAFGADYYVSLAGNDENNGSKEHPWKTIEKVNKTSFQPRDKISFEAPSTFDGPLIPSSSGLPNQPILYTNYGQGKAKLVNQGNGTAIYLNSKSNIQFTNLELSAPNGPGIIISEKGSGTTDILFENIVIHDCGLDGITSSNPLDARITLSRSSISNIQACGIFLRASNFVISNCSITNTGLNNKEQLKHPLHGIYGHGPKITITGNTISEFQTSGISLRYNGNVVENNKITAQHRGLEGICYYQETGDAGTSLIRSNIISGVTYRGIGINWGAKTVQFSKDSNVASTTEHFIIVGNDITMKGDLAAKHYVDGISMLKVPMATVNNNSVRGTFKLAYHFLQPEKYAAEGNNWQANDRLDAIFMCNEKTMDLSRLKAVTKQHKGDKIIRPAR